jgi:hypothetical protein
LAQTRSKWPWKTSWSWSSAPAANTRTESKLSITLPESLMSYRHSFALYAYQDISPGISLEQKSYAGERVYFGILPSSREVFFQIPFPESQGFTASPNTFVSPEIDPRRG